MSDTPLHCQQEGLEDVILKHKTILCNLGVYENICKPMAVNGKGLVSLNDFLTSLLKLAPWANLLLGQVRDAIVTVNQCKSLNKGPLTDKAWAGQRTERVITLLAHLRRLLTPYRFDQCAAKMSKQDIISLRGLISLIDTKYVQPDGNESSVRSKRQLQAHDSNVSNVTLDSDGFPAMLRSPSNAKCGIASVSDEVPVPKQIFEEEDSEDLLDRLCLKRPSTSSSMEKSVHKKPACVSVLCPGFPRKLDTPKGTLKLTFAAGQSYIHFQDLKMGSTFLVSRSAKSSPDHHDEILNLAQKLAKLKHETGSQMKSAALKMRTW